MSGPPACVQMFHSNSCRGSPILTPPLPQGPGPSWDDGSREAGPPRGDCPQFLVDTGGPLAIHDLLEAEGVALKLTPMPPSQRTLLLLAA